MGRGGGGEGEGGGGGGERATRKTREEYRSFICVARLIHACGMNDLYVRHDSYLEYQGQKPILNTQMPTTLISKYLQHTATH